VLTGQQPNILEVYKVADKSGIQGVLNRIQEWAKGSTPWSLNHIEGEWYLHHGDTIAAYLMVGREGGFIVNGKVIYGGRLIVTPAHRPWTKLLKGSDWAGDRATILMAMKS